MAKAKKRKISAGDVASNRYASFRFELLERIECGIALEGTEVKALRNGGAQLKDGYALVRDGELWLHNVHIPPYGPAAAQNHGPERDRKLLAAGDVELHVGLREVALDRPHRDEKRLRDVAIAEPVSGQAADAALAGRE